tara:strand:+ start:6695 stop:7591 length:897 start_codon:yes stop_codon:yes gene_type:complete
MQFTRAKKSNLVSAEHVTFTPELASQILEEIPFERQRNIKPQHINRYVDDMRDNKWNSESVIKFHKIDNRLILLDGQNRLNACIKSGCNFDAIKLVFNSCSENYTNESYSVTDTGANRSLRDYIRANQVNKRYGLFEIDTEALISAVHFINSGFKHYTSIPASYRSKVNSSEKWVPFASKYFDIVANGHSSMRHILRRRSLVAVALHCFRDAEEKAVKFFTPFANRSVILTTNDPRYTLLNKMCLADRELADVDCRIVGRCWNAFVINRTLVELKKIKSKYETQFKKVDLLIPATEKV